MGMATHPIEELFPSAGFPNRSGVSRLRRRIARDLEGRSKAIQAESGDDAELALARQILETAGCTKADLVRCDESMLHFRIADDTEGTKLTSVIFARQCLGKLAEDHCRAVKLEYLERDIARARHRRRTYIFPHSLWALLDD